MVFVPKCPKLSDCESHDAASELFIVEGDSAALALNRIRDARFQAILPMQGKPMNAMRASFDSVCANQQFAALIEALGIQASDEPDLDSIRYQRVILLFDPDADGIHSRTLMLLFFYRWLTPLLEAGRVGDVHAPMWAVESPRLRKTLYLQSDQQLRAVRARLESSGVTNYQLHRARGLASLSDETLSELCVAPTTRRLETLSAEDAERAMELMESWRLDSRSAT